MTRVRRHLIRGILSGSLFPLLTIVSVLLVVIHKAPVPLAQPEDVHQTGHVRLDPQTEERLREEIRRTVEKADGTRKTEDQCSPGKERESLDQAQLEVHRIQSFNSKNCMGVARHESGAFAVKQHPRLLAETFSDLFAHQNSLKMRSHSPDTTEGVPSFLCQSNISGTERLKALKRFIASPSPEEVSPEPQVVSEGISAIDR